MIAEDLLTMLNNVNANDKYLYFITRTLKPSLKKSSKVLNKYSYKIYQIDIDDDIREHLHALTAEQLIRLVKLKPAVDPYDVITEEMGQLYKYELSDDDLPFSELIDQLYATPRRIKDLEEILKTEEIWAYCVGFLDSVLKDWFFTFKKILASKVATTERDNQQRSIFKRGLRTIFNTKSEKLELIEGETVVLDKQVDCYLFDNVFYIVRKRNFEQIAGLEMEFKDEAVSVVKELEDTHMIKGVAFITQQIEENPSIHRKLIRIAKIGNYRSLTPAVITKMQKVCKKRKLPLKVSRGKLVIENEEDTELVLKMLADYYKTGEVSGKSYGGYGGKEE